VTVVATVLPPAIVSISSLWKAIETVSIIVVPTSYETLDRPPFVSFQMNVVVGLPSIYLKY
jgi:hypothetical protein